MKSMKNLAELHKSLEKNLEKNVTFFVVSFASDDEDKAPTTSASKQTKKMSHFQELSPQNSGQLSSMTCSLKFFHKLN